MQGSQLEREKILSEQRDIHKFLERKADQAFQEKAQLRQSYLKRSLNWTEENGRSNWFQLQSQRMELHQANQLTDQSQREKSWPCGELERRTKLFRKTVQEVVNKLKNHEEFAVQELRGPDN